MFHSVVLVWPKTGGFADVLGRHGGNKSCDAIIEEIIDLTVKEMSKKNDSTESSKALSTSLANLL